MTTDLRTDPSSVTENAEVLLKQFFQRSGYVRVGKAARKKRWGGQYYKRGYEVRLVISTPSELAQIHHVLQQVGFKVAKPFQKHSRIVQPIYGKAAVEWFAATNPYE